MTSYQEASERSGNSVLQFLTVNAAITATIPNLNPTITSTQQILLQIHNTKPIQLLKNDASIETKNQLRDVLNVQGFDIIKRTLAMGQNTNNLNILKLLKISDSDLKKYSDAKAEGVFQMIHSIANSNLTALPTYGITASTLTNFQTNLTNFSALLPKNLVGTADKDETTILLKSLFKSLAANFKKMDVLVDMVIISQPVFNHEYHRLRRIIVMGKGSLVLRTKVINAETGSPEGNVKVTIMPIEEYQNKDLVKNGKYKSKKTSRTGVLNYKNMADGTYVIIAQKTGFQDLTEKVNIVNGEMKTVVLKMILK